MSGFAAAVAIEAGVGVVAICLGWILELEPAATLHIDFPGFATGLIATVPMLAGFALMRRSRWESLAQIKAALDEMLPLILPDPSLGRLALISLAAGLGEELFFRGLLQGGLDRALGTGTGLILAAIAFGIAHPVSRAYAVIATIIGAYLGGLWILSGNLLVPIVSHAAYDFVALIVVTRAARLRPVQPPRIEAQP